MNRVAILKGEDTVEVAIKALEAVQQEVEEPTNVSHATYSSPLTSLRGILFALLKLYAYQ